jgi:hypothetical protein
VAVDLAGLIADQVVEAWWLRRERQRDAANRYVGSGRCGGAFAIADPDRLSELDLAILDQAKGAS